MLPIFLQLLKRVLLISLSEQQHRHQGDPDHKVIPTINVMPYQIDRPRYGPHDDYYALEYIQLSTSCISHLDITMYTHMPASVRTRLPISVLGLHPCHWLPLLFPSEAGSLVFGPLISLSPSCIPSFWPRNRAIMYSRYGFFFCHMASFASS